MLLRIFPLSVENSISFVKLFSCVAVFEVTKSGGSDKSCGHHANTTHETHRYSTSGWEAVSDYSEHGRPEECLTNSVYKKRTKGRAEGCDCRYEIETNTT